MKKRILLVLFLALLISFGNEGWLQLYRLNKIAESRELENRSLADKNEVLRQEIRNLNEPPYLEHLIREQLGYMKSNEIVYEFLED